MHAFVGSSTWKWHVTLKPFNKMMVDNGGPYSSCASPSPIRVLYNSHKDVPTIEDVPMPRPLFELSLPNLLKFDKHPLGSYSLAKNGSRRTAH